MKCISSDYKRLRGKRLKCSKLGHETKIGILVGLDISVMRPPSANVQTHQPWKIQLDDDGYEEITPEDGWDIEILK